MKFYLVSEEQLARLSIETIRFTENFTPETILSAQRANDDCRKIEVPEWARYVTEECPEGMAYEEIKS